MSDDWNIYEVRARHERGEISDAEFARLSLNRGLKFFGFGKMRQKLLRSDFADEKMTPEKKMLLIKECGEVFGLDRETMESPKKLVEALAQRGLDCKNNAQIRGYLMNNGRMK